MAEFVVLDGDCGITVVPDVTEVVVDTSDDDDVVLSDDLDPLADPEPEVSVEFFSSMAR